MRGDFDEDEFYDDDEFDDSGNDCGMGPDGLCQYAGTEQCDDCPFNE